MTLSNPFTDPAHEISRRGSAATPPPVLSATAGCADIDALDAYLAEATAAMARDSPDSLEKTTALPASPALSENSEDGPVMIRGDDFVSTSFPGKTVELGGRTYDVESVDLEPRFQSRLPTRFPPRASSLLPSRTFGSAKTSPESTQTYESTPPTRTVPSGLAAHVTDLARIESWRGHVTSSASPAPASLAPFTELPEPTEPLSFPMPPPVPRALPREHFDVEAQQTSADPKFFSAETFAYLFCGRRPAWHPRAAPREQLNVEAQQTPAPPKFFSAETVAALRWALGKPWPVRGWVILLVLVAFLISTFTFIGVILNTAPGN